MTALVALGSAGCSRSHYRVRADVDAYGLIQEKTALAPWSPPLDYSIEPDPRSRLYDPTPIDHPVLPPPYPRLYSYELPELTPRPASPWAMPGAQAPALSDARSIIPLPKVASPAPRSQVVHAVAESDGEFADQESSVRFVNHLEPTAFQPPSGDQGPVLSGQEGDAPGGQDEPLLEDLPQPPAGAGTSQDAADQAGAQPDGRPSAGQQPVDVTVTPIPESAWQSIGDVYVSRMLEFESVREEYRTSFGAEPPQSLRITAPRLTFPDIVELTLINSREYQTQKETLYRAALRLSLERFDYQLKHSAGGAGTAVNWSENISGGTLVDTLSIPTDVQVDKMLNTGGTLLAQLANSIVLTFNGPTGFAADVSSDLMLSLSHSVFQTDVRFESLTSAERGLVYAARDFARFRKQLFVDLAQQYYQLIRSYRQIEINSQNYFAFIRVFEQNREEYLGGFLERIGLDQFEQQTLTGRSSLIQSSTSLERALDSLKLRIGIPPETQINLDLGELDQLTLRDEVSVNGDLIRRAARQITQSQAAEEPDRTNLLNPAIMLIERLQHLHDLRRRLGLPARDTHALDILGARLLIDRERLDVARNREGIDNVERAPIQVFQQSMDLVDAILDLILQQETLAGLLDVDADQLADLHARRLDLQQRADQLHEELETALANADVSRQAEFVQRARDLLSETETLSEDATRLSQDDTEQLTDEELLTRTLEQMEFLKSESEAALAEIGASLPEVGIPLDDAMLTALVQRYDLMTQREQLADDWRQIKYAADDLKSILNLSASTNVGTDTDHNRPFAFTFNESRTSASLQFDAPLNRFSQRNSYRQALIDYQAGLRSLAQSEDNVKLDIRNDLRDLGLAKNQYAISVAQAALAYERVLSVQLTLQLGLPGVIPRDFTDAQNDYTQALSGVASDHIDYILLRMQLFFDMELLTLGDDGFWHELYDDAYQPLPAVDPPGFAWPLYGELPPHVHYSKEIRQMIEGLGGHVIYEVGPGESPPAEYETPDDALIPNQGDVEPEPIPTPPGYSEYFRPPPIQR